MSGSVIALRDKDPMPMGVHKGKAMEDVPAQYLLYIADQDWIGKWPRIKEYIEANRDVLEKEISDPKAFGM